MTDVVEDKIIFQENDEVRVLRGKITKEDDTFIYLERKDGLHRINKKFIVKIKEGNDG